MRLLAQTAMLNLKLISRKAKVMTLRPIGTTSDDGDCPTLCPTLYEVEETGDIVVQGDRLTDPAHRAQLRDVKDSETFVVIPRKLLTRVAPRSDVPDLIPFSEVAHDFQDFGYRRRL